MENRDKNNRCLIIFINNHLYYISNLFKNHLIFLPLESRTNQRKFTIKKEHITSVTPLGKSKLAFKTNNNITVSILFLTRTDRSIFSAIINGNDQDKISQNLYFSSYCTSIFTTVIINDPFNRNIYANNIKSKLSKRKLYYFPSYQLYDIINYANRTDYNTFLFSTLSFSFKSIKYLLFTLNSIKLKIEKYTCPTLKRSQHIIYRRKTDSNIKRGNPIIEKQDADNLEFITPPDSRNFKFMILINKFFSYKEEQIIQFPKKGTFAISPIPQKSITKNSNASDAYASLSLKQISNIVKMDSIDNKNLKLVLTLKENNNTERLTTLTFNSLYDKFLFKSIIYHNFLSLDYKSYQNKYIKFKVKILTWNLAESGIPGMLHCFNINTLKNIDIVAMGVQECAIFKKSEWLKQLKALLRLYNFVDITSIEMWQMFIIVFVYKDLTKYIDSIYSEYKAMGFGNMIGNKGGVIISFRLMNYQFVFVNCHLAPKPYGVLERNKMVKELTNVFRLSNNPSIEFDVAADYIFWFGDMNYRVDLPFTETISKLRSPNTNEAIKFLLNKDQLIKERKKNSVFYAFIEPEISFLPTYRRKKKKEKVEQMEHVQRRKAYKAQKLTRSTSANSYSERNGWINANKEKYNKRRMSKKKLNISPLKVFCAEKEGYNDTDYTNEDNESMESNIKFIKLAIGNSLKRNMTQSDTFSLQDDNGKINPLELFISKQEEIAEYSNKEDQSPSWCDRILVKSNRDVNCILYTSWRSMRSSDHLPVEGKYAIYLTAPFINENEITQSEHGGYFIYSQLVLKYDFESYLEELSFEISFPFKIELVCQFELNEKNIITISNAINDINEALNNKIKFNNIKLPFYPQMLFDYPQGKALNIFFVFYLVDKTGKKYEMGYTKYSLEMIERFNLSIMNHIFSVDVILRTRKLGIFSFNGDYHL